MKKEWCVPLSELLIVLGVCLLCPSGTALAQAPATTLEQLQSRVAAGQTITVVDSSGQKIRGQISGLSASELKLDADGKQRTYTSETLAEVRTQHKDSLWNGTLIGAAAGSIFLIGMVASDWCSDEASCGGSYAWGVAYMGMGAAAGAGIDALRKGQITVYRRSSSAVGVAPVLNPRAQGVLVSVKF